MPSSEFCRLHFAGGAATLPCPWPDCIHGHDADVFLDSRFPPLSKEYRRESFIAADGEPRFFWISRNEGYGWAVRSTVRSELLRLAQPSYGAMYHYTSLEGFQGIIESSDLWLTDSAFMNDASELEHGVDLSREVFESRATNGSPIADVLRGLTNIPVAARPRVNIACFSSARDHLSQWRAYSQNTVGIALGFATEKLMPALGYPSECTLVPVLYSDTHKRALLDCFARFFSEAYSRDAMRQISVRQRDGSSKEFYPTDGYNNSLSGLFFELVTSCKHSAFADEHEIRLVYTEHNDIIESFNLERAKKRFRRANGFLAPYTTVDDIRETNLDRTVERERFPLTEVIVGPHPRAELTALSIRQFLDTHGYSDVPVSQSAAPYR